MSLVNRNCRMGARVGGNGGGKCVVGNGGDRGVGGFMCHELLPRR